jgi:hypothetical protein
LVVAVYYSLDLAGFVVSPSVMIVWGEGASMHMLAAHELPWPPFYHHDSCEMRPKPGSVRTELFPMQVTPHIMVDEVHDLNSLSSAALNFFLYYFSDN